MSGEFEPVTPTVAALWEQLSLLTYPVLEAQFLLGVCDEGSHWQYQWTLTNPSSGDLVAMLSSHAVPRPLVLSTAQRAAAELAQVMLELSSKR